MASKKKTKSKNKTKATKKQEMRTIFPHCKVKKDGANIHNKALICNYDGTSKAFAISDIGDAIRFVQNEYDITIQLNNISIPDDINPIVRKEIEAELNKFILLAYSNPFQKSVAFVVKAHGNNWEAKSNKRNVSSSDCFYAEDDDGDKWFYKRYDYECKCELENNDNASANDYRIFYMSARLPHIRIVWFEYNASFSLQLPAQEGCDIIIKTLKGGMKLKLGDNEAYHVAIFRSVYIRDDVAFSYEMDPTGGVVEFTFLNTRMAYMSYGAVQEEKDSKMTRFKEEQENDEPDDQDNESIAQD